MAYRKGDTVTIRFLDGSEIETTIVLVRPERRSSNLRGGIFYRDACELCRVSETYKHCVGDNGSHIVEE